MTSLSDPSALGSSAGCYEVTASHEVIVVITHFALRFQFDPVNSMRRTLVIRLQFGVTCPALLSQRTEASLSAGFCFLYCMGRRSRFPVIVWLLSLSLARALSLSPSLPPSLPRALSVSLSLSHFSKVEYSACLGAVASGAVQPR